MTQLVFKSESPEHTQALGQALGRAARSGDLLLLEGPFGSGKTVLVQGLAAGLGVPGQVSSPSFVLIAEHRGRLPLNHIDLYRLEGRFDPEFLESIEETLGGDGITAIEWPAGLPADLSEGATRLRFEQPNDTTRIVQIDVLAHHLEQAARAVGATTWDEE